MKALTPVQLVIQFLRKVLLSHYYPLKIFFYKDGFEENKTVFQTMIMNLVCKPLLKWFNVRKQQPKMIVSF